MRYFTEELWTKINHGSQEECELAEKQWDKNLAEYTLLFDEFKIRLPKGFLRKYITNGGFHDFRILDIRINQKEYGKKNPISVEILITDERKAYKITYQSVVKYQMHYEENVGCRGIDDWGYSEFLPLDDDTFSHEILFASGSTVLIHAASISISKQKIY